MRRLVKIVSENEYEAWLKNQKSTYLTTIRNTDEDPFKGQILDIEVKQRRADFNSAVEKIIKSDSLIGRQAIRLDHIQFETGSAKLTAESKYELDNIIELLTNNSTMRIEIDGHTDNTGNAAENLILSNNRAAAVKEYLVNKGIDGARLVATGFGQTKPIDSNDTDAGRKNNRRTEFKILSK
jgi:outer membrane protein OmpA-like peptidoglycan-associated protein